MSWSSSIARMREAITGSFLERSLVFSHRLNRGKFLRLKVRGWVKYSTLSHRKLEIAGAMGKHECGSHLSCGESSVSMIFKRSETSNGLLRDTIWRCCSS